MSLTPEKLQQIFERIAETGNASRAFRDCGVVPSTFWRALEDKPELRDNYAKAKVTGMRALAEEILELTDKPVETDLQLAQRRLQVDTRKWVLAKMLPKQYGDRMVHAGDAENPIGIKDVSGAREILAAKFGVAGELATSGTSSEDSEA